MFSAPTAWSKTKLFLMMLTRSHQHRNEPPAVKFHSSSLSSQLIDIPLLDMTSHQDPIPCLYNKYNKYNII